MDKFGSTLELVREAEDIHKMEQSLAQTNNLDDLSSGYGSDEVDEKSSLSTNVLSAPKHGEQNRRNRMSEEVMLYSSRNNILQTLKCVITMPEMCDVTFLVGRQMTPVYGVKAILMTRSRVLYQIILSCQKEALLKNKSKKSTHRPKMINGRLAIHIDGYDDVTFRRFNQFVHCGKVQLDVQTAVGLLCAASEFQLSDLKQACMDFINKMIIDGRILELEMNCADYSNHSASRKILEKIHSHRKETAA